MKWIILTPLILLLIIYVCEVHFLAVMNLMQARDEGKLPPITYKLVLPIVAIGVFIDVFTQMTSAVVLFLEWPKEWMVSGRVKRILQAKKQETGLERWRYSVALWIRDNLLRPFDRSGGHNFED